MLSSRKLGKIRTQTGSPSLLSTKIRTPVVPAIAFALIAVAAKPSAADHVRVEQYHAIELSLTGPYCRPADGPARDVQLDVVFQHESGAPTIRVAAFFDGDGRGGNAGEVFKVRFCPPQPGTWTVVDIRSNAAKPRGLRVGDKLTCTQSSHPGFWIADGRWYRRSDDSHPYIVGNTHYTFLSRRRSSRDPRGVAVSQTPVESIRGNARFYKKLRFSLTGGRYPDLSLKPFLDDRGKQTDDGRFSFRPNPTWFHERVDPVVREAFELDLICDLILCGPDTQENRSTLKGDPRAWLKYVAARYGAYPNVWFCLCNEWNIKNPSYSVEEIQAAGRSLQRLLPFATPISVHGNHGPWDERLNGDWNDHIIIQDKIKSLGRAADVAHHSFLIGGKKPVINDENAYQGNGDRFSKEDVVEGCFGTFLGGAYPTTGCKRVSKADQYFWGDFDADAHSASAHLAYLCNYVENSVSFWRLKPCKPSESIFAALPAEFRVLCEPGKEYVLGSNRRAETLQVKLPEGKWRVGQVDLLAMTTRALSESASGRFAFGTPDSRAVLTHFKRITP